MNTAAQSRAAVSVSMSSPGTEVRITDMVMHAGNVPIPNPGEGMLNVLIKINLGGQVVTLSRSASVKDFKFTVPEALLPPSIISTTNRSDELVERAVQANGDPLPSWIKYDPETNTFIANEVPAGAKAIDIRIQTIKDGKVLEESPPITIDAR